MNRRSLFLVRVALAVLIVLPPGTFRTLDHIGRAWAGVSIPEMKDGEQSFRDEAFLPPWTPLARDWQNFHFTSKGQSDSTSVFPSAWSAILPRPVESLPDARPSMPACIESALGACPAARDVIIALQELLR